MNWLLCITGAASSRIGIHYGKAGRDEQENDKKAEIGYLMPVVNQSALRKKRMVDYNTNKPGHLFGIARLIRSSEYQ